jgi:hypothetical protein
LSLAALAAVVRMALDSKAAVAGAQGHIAPERHLFLQLVTQSLSAAAALAGADLIMRAAQTVAMDQIALLSL